MSGRSPTGSSRSRRLGGGDQGPQEGRADALALRGRVDVDGVLDHTRIGRTETGTATQPKTRPSLGDQPVAGQRRVELLPRLSSPPLPPLLRTFPASSPPQQADSSPGRGQHPVVDPGPAPFGADQPGLAQHLQVVEIVGCEIERPVRSHTHASPPSWEAISDSSRSRTGSDRALNIRDSSAAAASPSGSRTSGAQHAGVVLSEHRQLLVSTCLYIDSYLCRCQARLYRQIVETSVRMGAAMSRVQLALRVADLEGSIAFYSKLFGTEPAKRRPGYANFAIAEPPLKLVLHRRRGGRGHPHGPPRRRSGRHRRRSTAATERLKDAGLATFEENDTSCCYALQDKVWVHGPGGEPWEVYVVKADADTLGKSPPPPRLRVTPAAASTSRGPPTPRRPSSSPRSPDASGITDLPPGCGVPRPGRSAPGSCSVRLEQITPGSVNSGTVKRPDPPWRGRAAQGAYRR